jgi:DNA polymerase-3 subunit delta'
MRETIGHDAAWQRLSGAVARGQVHHAYLFTGAGGIGKTTLALDFAKLLLCEGGLALAESPCGACAACRKIAHGNHPDVALVEAENGKRLLGVEAVREAVVRMANLAPSAGAWRVFILPRAERMTPNTVNALLKTLEEPPPNAVIVLTTVEPDSLLPTVLSRCQLLPLRPLPAKQVSTALCERWRASPDDASALAALARGRIGWAVRALAEPALREAQEEAQNLLASLTSAPRDQRLRAVATLAPDAEAARDSLADWLLWWRDVTLAACGTPHLSSTGALRAEAERQGRLLGRERAEAFLRTLLAALAAFDANANPRLTFDVLLLELPSLGAAGAPRA